LSLAVLSHNLTEMIKAPIQIRLCLLLALTVSACTLPVKKQIPEAFRNDYEFDYLMTVRNADYYSYEGIIQGHLEPGTRVWVGSAWKITQADGIERRLMSTYDESIAKDGFYVRIEDLNIEQFPAGTSIGYRVDRDIAWRIIGGKQFPIKGVSVERDRTDGKIGAHFIMDDNSAAKLDQEKSGTYIFDRNGKLLTILPIGATEESTGVFIAPDEKYFGADGGT